MEHFDNVVIAVATLMEPLMASLIAFAAHAGLLVSCYEMLQFLLLIHSHRTYPTPFHCSLQPGLLGWFGNFLVVVGTLGVVYPSVGKKSGGEMH